MNAEKYTQKALEAVKTAQNMAQENGNQYAVSYTHQTLPTIA